MTGENSEQVPSTIAGDTRLKVLLRSVEEIDRELDAIAAGAPAARRDVALAGASLAAVDDLLASLGAGAPREEFVWSAAPPPVEDAPSVVEDAPPEVVLSVDDAVEASSGALPQEFVTEHAEAPAEREEDVPLRLLDFEPLESKDDALATAIDLPDLSMDAPPASPSAIETLIVALDHVAPTARSSLPLAVAPSAFPGGPRAAEAEAELSLDGAEFAQGLEFEAPPESQATAHDEAAADLGAAVESMLIDEDEVVVEGAPLAPFGGLEASVLMDTDDVLVEAAPVAATGTLLGVSPTFRPGLAESTRAPENDLGEIVFNLEPELEVAKGSSPPVLASRAPRGRESLSGAPPAKAPPKSRDSLDNFELDLSEFVHGEARPPSLRPPPLLRQPPPPPTRTAPPPVPRASKPRVEVEEIVELDDQELEVLKASSRPPPGAESKAPPPVPQRPGGQK